MVVRLLVKAIIIGTGKLIQSKKRKKIEREESNNAYKKREYTKSKKSIVSDIKISYSQVKAKREGTKSLKDNVK